MVCGVCVWCVCKHLSVCVCVCGGVCMHGAGACMHVYPRKLCASVNICMNILTNNVDKLSCLASECKMHSTDFGFTNTYSLVVLHFAQMNLSCM